MSTLNDDFIEAMKKIRSDPKMSHDFMQDPHGTLASLGVHVGKSATLAAGAPTAAAVCVGACVCVG
jgi:hypothetical protein